MPIRSSNKNTIRIIGGNWRSRLIDFPAIDGLRPTPDRVRETLFNWLMSSLQGARCLDLFAGSGALGFEALSRGARSVVMVDQSQQVVLQLIKNAKLLHAEHAQIICGSFPEVVQSIDAQTFDIVFLDPPFHKNLISSCCQWLEESQRLSAAALIYIEAEKELQPLPVPQNWQIIHSKTAGQVGYHLLQRFSGNR